MSMVTALELILHPYFNAAYMRLVQVIERGLAGESLILFLLALTRAGKTEIVRTVLNDYPPSIDGGSKVIPVLRVTTPVNPTRKSLPEALLAALDPRSYGRCSADQLTARACGLLKIAGTRVIIFDEVQHFVERSSKAAAREAADWIKLLAEEMSLTIVMTGLPIAQEILDHNEQLRDRAEATYYLYPYSWSDPTDRAAFNECVVVLSDVFRREGWSILNHDCSDFTRRVYAATLGRIGMLIKLFNAAEAIAVNKQLDLSVFATAYAQSIGTNFLPCNPFAPDACLDDSLLVQGYVSILNEAHMPLPHSGHHARSISLPAEAYKL